MGWNARGFRVGRKSDPEKLGIPGRLRLETHLTLRRIAERLNLGSPKSANALIIRWMKSQNAGRGESKNARL